MLTQSSYTFYLSEKYTTVQTKYPNMELEPYFVFFIPTFTEIKELKPLRDVQQYNLESVSKRGQRI